MPLHIQLLGSFNITYDEQQIDTIKGSPRLQSLLAYLLLHHSSPQFRQQIAYQLWPVSSESQARTNLRKLFLQLRRALPDADAFLTFDNQTIQWQIDAPFMLDITKVQRLLKSIDDDPLDRKALTKLFDLYTGKLLPNCYDDWIIPLREQLHQDVMAALDRLVTLLENQRAYEEGISYAQRLLMFDPLDEKSYQRLMRLHAANGDRAGALKAYQECIDVLDRELGVEPVPETQALHQRLLQAKDTTSHQAKPQPALDLPPLIGRQAEWQVLQNVWQNSAQGKPSFVTISGEAGIGKTRLAEELFMWASQQGIATARTRSYQAQGALVYAPVTELLRSNIIYTQLSRLPEHRLTQIARLLPELLADEPDLVSPMPMIEDWQRQQFFDALNCAILRDQQPLVLLLDDLQWCDSETLDWLQYLLTRTEHAALMVMGTIRTGEIEKEHLLKRLLFNLRRDDLLTEITLSSLNANEVTELAQSIGDSNFVSEQAEALYSNTAGNPLFVIETVRAGLNDQKEFTVQAKDTGLPPKIYAVIQSRISQLSPEAQLVANLAAVNGRSFTYSVLLRAISIEEEDLVDSLDELLIRQIICEQTIDVYDFSHDRIRDVVYNEISHTRRRLLHRRVAEALEELNGQSLESVTGLLAEHYALAGNHRKAIDYFYVASQSAVKQFSHKEALHLLEKALTLADQQDHELRYRLLDARLRIHKFLKDFSAWLDDLCSFEALIDAWIEADVSRRQKWQADFALHSFEYQEAITNYDEALIFAKKAVKLARLSGDSTTEAQALLGCGKAFLGLSEFNQAKESLTLALDIARISKLDSIAAESLEFLMNAYMFSGGKADQIEAALRECLAIYERADNQKGIASIYNKQGFLPVAQGIGDYELALPHYDRALLLYQQWGVRTEEAIVLRNQAVLHTCSGDYRAAERCIQQALSIEESIGRADWVAVVLNYQGFNLFNLGRLADAQFIQESAMEKLRSSNLSHYGLKAWTALGWIHFYQGEIDTAQKLLEESLVHCVDLNEVRQMGYTYSCLGHLLTEQNKLEEAREAYQQALDAHQRMEQYNRAIEPKAGLAYVAQLQGDHRLALIEVDQILDHLRTYQLDRTEEGFYVYLLCHRILSANQDKRAGKLLQETYGRLQARAATIDDPEHQRMFWEEMPGHREIADAIKVREANR